ncbi:Cubilin [Stylophora pistillata]|uniref:Cubilin n=1 Tax=Stylophora pistillata TaxID=50429 RepID=A0A2B4RJ57_STYPI|nr:Cubilin [Stylophora pistillata]
MDALGSRDIERCKDCECDSIKINSTYNGLDQRYGKECGRYSNNYLYEYLFFVDWSGGLLSDVSGSIAYIRFVSDDTGHYKGFNLTFIAGSSADGGANYLNASEDETITFGTPKAGAQNYPADYREQWFLIVPEGRQVQIDFDTFDLEDSEDCENDYVEFREAYVTVGDPKNINGQYGPILTKHLCGKTKPSSIQSKENIVWVQFKSDSNSTTVYKGFKASFKAGTFSSQDGNAKEDFD